MSGTTSKPKFAAKRLDAIPPYLFAEIDKKRQAAIARGVDVVNLGIGDPDQPTPRFIVDSMHAAIDDPSTHNYPPYQGTAELRKASVSWFARRFPKVNKKFDIDTECLVTIGMKEALHNLFLATVDPGDYTLIPDPGYPVYRTSTVLCGGIAHLLPLTAENNFLPDLKAIPEEVAQKAKLLVLNYPNNPTGAFATLEFFAEAVAFAKKYNILLVHDNSYSELYFDRLDPPPSIFEVPGAEEIALEMFSLSKGFNMTGWRVGFTVGCAEGIKALGTVKTNVDSGVFKAIQRAACVALDSDQAHLTSLCSLYESRSKVLEAGMKELGWTAPVPCKGTLYAWYQIPRKYTSSIEFASAMLDQLGIVVPPGVGYGLHGEGYFRIALSASEEKIREALKRMKDAGFNY